MAVNSTHRAAVYQDRYPDLCKNWQVRRTGLHSFINYDRPGKCIVDEMHRLMQCRRIKSRRLTNINSPQKTGNLLLLLLSSSSS